MTERAISSSWIDFLSHENVGEVIDLGSKSITLKSAIASSPVSRTVRLTAAPDRTGVAPLDRRIDGRHVAGRKDVGQEKRLFVGDAAGTLIGPTSVIGL